MIPEEALQIVLNYLEECGISYMISGSFAGTDQKIMPPVHWNQDYFPYSRGPKPR